MINQIQAALKKNHAISVQLQPKSEHSKVRGIILLPWWNLKSIFSVRTDDQRKWKRIKENHRWCQCHKNTWQTRPSWGKIDWKAVVGEALIIFFGFYILHVCLLFKLSRVIWKHQDIFTQQVTVNKNQSCGQLCIIPHRPRRIFNNQGLGLNAGMSISQGGYKTQVDGNRRKTHCRQVDAHMVCEMRVEARGGWKHEDRIGTTGYKLCHYLPIFSLAGWLCFDKEFIQYSTGPEYHVGTAFTRKSELLSRRFFFQAIPLYSWWRKTDVNRFR